MNESTAAVRSKSEGTAQTRPSDSATSTLMAFTAGFVDTASFVALFGLFAAHVTGNFVLIGASLANHRPGILGKLLAFPVFLLAVAATRLFLYHCERRHRDATRSILFGQIVFLILFLIVGVLAAPINNADAPLAIFAGMLGVTAMAIQNAASRTLFAGHSPTTVMTGNVTQVMMDLVDLVLGVNLAIAHSRLRKMIPTVLGFALGAVAGGLGFVWLGFWSLVCPIIAMLVVLAWHWRRSDTG